MYRGVLHVQMGEEEKARTDLQTLLKLDPKLAQELEWVLKNKIEKTPEKFFGVTAKMKKTR
jgi:hypothetical protein